MKPNPMLSVNASGRVLVPLTKDEFYLRNIEDPVSFFSAKRREYTELGVASDYPGYSYISADTTHNCNLRCVFCFDDFANATHTRMSFEDFSKLLSLTELVPDGGMFLSCLYEPFLHPRFADLLRIVPEVGRRKCFFTSNMCVKRFKEDVFEALSQANIAYMNVSLDSLRPDVYERLRVNADFDVFQQNLRNLNKAFSEASNPPSLRFISMALRSNCDELVDMIKITSEKFGATQHEVRMPFELAHASPEWAQAELLSADEWLRLEEEISALPYSIKVMPDGGTARYYGPTALPGLV